MEEEKKTPVRKSTKATTAKTPVKKTASKPASKTAKKASVAPVKNEKEIEPVVEQVVPVTEPVEVPLAPDVPAEEKPVEAPLAPVAPVEAMESVEVIEAPAPKAPTPAVTKAEVPAKAPAVFYPLEEAKAEEDYSKVVETKRKEFYDKFKVFRYINFAITGVALAIVVALFVFIFVNKNEKLQFVVYILLGVALVALIGNIVFSRIARPKQYGLLSNYVREYSVYTNSVIFEAFRLTDAKVAPEGNIKDSEVIDAHLFTVINRINSRGRVEGKLAGKDFVSAEVAVLVPMASSSPKSNGKSVEAYGVYGRYIAYDLCLANNQAIIVSRKGSDTIAPNHLLGYHELKVEGLAEDFSVHCTSDDVSAAVLTPEQIDTLNSLSLNNYVNGFHISINEKGTFVALCFTDEALLIPFNKPLAPNVIESARESMFIVNKFLLALK